jgi:hypothetical protein
MQGLFLIPFVEDLATNQIDMTSEDRKYDFV